MIMALTLSSPWSILSDFSSVVISDMSSLGIPELPVLCSLLASTFLTPFSSLAALWALGSGPMLLPDSPLLPPA